MACITSRKNGRWELRESVSTERGPRSRTLASFRELTPQVLAHARARADHPLTEAEVVRAARRAGAPIAPDPVGERAAGLLADLVSGRRPRPALARLLRSALGEGGESPSHAELAVARWIGASAEERGETLRDLLLLADRLPAPRRRRPRFPRIASSPR